MITISGLTRPPELQETEQTELAGFDHFRQADIASIRRFVESNCNRLKGRVLDFGAGKPGTCRQPEPYRDLVVGEYIPVDKDDPIPHGPYDAVLCTQVTQYLTGLPDVLAWFQKLLYVREGSLVMTYATNWPEVEKEDLFRYTREGMERLLSNAGFAVQIHEPRAGLLCHPNTMVFGYGVVAVPRKG